MAGCGSFALLCHGPAQRMLRAASADVTLAACCDTDPASSRDYMAAFGFGRSYADLREMLEAERPDAVILAVPPAATCAAACAVLGRGVPLLLEKPPGLDPAELERMILAQEKGGAGAQVAFNRHYMPVMRRALEILGGSFPAGEVERIDYEMVRAERWDPDFSTTAVHAIDGALVLARSPFRTAELAFQPQSRGGREATDVTVRAECECGSRVSVRIRPVSSSNSDSARVDAAGQSLSLAIPVSPQSPGVGSAEHRRKGVVVGSYSGQGLGAPESLGVLGETEAFLNGVRAGGPFSPGLRDCRQRVALMDAIRRRDAGPFRFGTS